MIYEMRVYRCVPGKLPALLKDLALARRTGVAVPLASVVYGPSGPTVLVVNGERVEARAIRTGERRMPTFDTAVDLHHCIDALRQSSDSGREVILG